MEAGNDKLITVQCAFDKSKFLEKLISACNYTSKKKEDFLVAIKPNIMTASIKETPSPVYTDPGLVEYLIDRIYENGFRKIVVVEA